MMQYVLDGIRVISLAEQYPGPYATLVLSDLGADVIQVERPDGGDPARQFPGFYDALNRNKRSITLDLKSPAGVDAFLQLVTEADAVLEGFRPGTVDRLGVGYQDVKRVNPHAVYVSISGYGQVGPYRDWPGHDIAYQALAGLLAGGHEQEQPGASLQVGDLAAGMFAVIATLLGLLHRKGTGSGLYVDLSMFDVLVSMMSATLVPLLNGATAATFTGTPAYGTFPTADGRAIAVAVAHEDKFWRSLCDALELPQYADLSGAERLARAEELRRALAEAFATRKRDEWVSLLLEADVPVAPVLDAQDVGRDPHVGERGLLVEVAADGAASARTYLRQPLVIPGYAFGPRRPAPKLGEHTTEILGGT